MAVGSSISKTSVDGAKQDPGGLEGPLCLSSHSTGHPGTTEKTQARGRAAPPQTLHDVENSLKLESFLRKNRRRRVRV